MGHFYKMYELTKWVDGQSNLYDQDHPDLAILNRGRYVKAEHIISEYSKEKGLPPPIVRNLLASCRADDYIQDSKGTIGLYVRVNPGKGTRFLREFLKIPTGFLKEVIGDNSLILSLISGFIGGMIPLIIYLLTK